MKQIALLILMTVAALPAADKKPSARHARSKPVATPKRVAVTETVAIPKDAVQVDANTYTAIDAKGKKWIYRRTPFGISRAEERAPSAEEAAQAAKVIAATTAVERGDEIEFARPGPFGQYRWQRKKSDLNEMEKTVWERELRKSSKAAPRQE